LGIKVTIIEPGAFRTDFSGRSLSVPEQQIEDYAQTAGKFIPLLSLSESDPYGERITAIFRLR
jgi:hypothetical protein